MTCPRRLFRLLSCFVPMVLAGTTMASGQGAASGCRADNLVPWNCAYGFSGSLEWKSILKGGAPGGVQVNIREDVTVTINAGNATCLGARSGTTRVEGESETQIATTIKGAGVVAVEYGTNTEDDPKGPYYRITVACPSPDGEEVSTNLRNGEKTVTRVVATPPDKFRNGEMGSYKQPGTDRDAVLQGTTVDEHPEADAANGLTGTITVTWRLSKNRKP